MKLHPHHVDASHTLETLCRIIKVEDASVGYIIHGI